MLIEKIKQTISLTPPFKTLQRLPTILRIKSRFQSLAGLALLMSFFSLFIFSSSLFCLRAIALIFFMSLELSSLILTFGCLLLILQA